MKQYNKIFKKFLDELNEKEILIITKDFSFEIELNIHQLPHLLGLKTKKTTSLQSIDFTKDISSFFDTNSNTTLKTQNAESIFNILKASTFSGTYNKGRQKLEANLMIGTIAYVIALIYETKTNKYRPCSFLVTDIRSEVETTIPIEMILIKNKTEQLYNKITKRRKNTSYKDVENILTKQNNFLDKIDDSIFNLK